MKKKSENCKILICLECGEKNIIEMTGKELAAGEDTECWNCGLDLCDGCEDISEDIS